MSTTNDPCEGCDLPGQIDWHGLWLCAACLIIEEETADPILAEEREMERRQKAALEWPASERGDTDRCLLHWAERVMREMELME